MEEESPRPEETANTANDPTSAMTVQDPDKVEENPPEAPAEEKEEKLAPMKDDAEAESETPDATETELTTEKPIEGVPTEKTSEDTLTERPSEYAPTDDSPAKDEQDESTEKPEEPTETAEEKEPIATVKFQLVPSGKVITTASGLSQNIASLKNMVAAELGAAAEDLLITYNGENADLDNTLSDLNVVPNGTIQFEVVAVDPSKSFEPVKPKPQVSSPDVITVRVEKENNEFNEIIVEIERQSMKKAFIGGYRHKLSGAEYHHASAQTSNKKPKVSTTEKFNRDCQTVFERNRTQQTTNVTSTQMPKVGCYISTDQDKIIVPRKYVSYDEYMARRIKAIIVLQSYFRRWQARHLVEELKADRDRRIEWERQEEIRKRKEKEDRIKREFEKRINPKTREDFDLLYSALEKWRLEELGHINDEFTGAERKAALCALLEQETQLIGSIDRRKIDAYKEGKEKKILQFLDKAAAPKKWKAYDGRFTEMDTQYTIRAKELRDIYNSINMKYLTQDERLDVLLTLKHTVKEHDCKLTREITELIDREADLLMRGMKDSNLEGLRKRISSLFLQYCKNPLFNPEAARLLKVPQDPASLVKDIYFCPSSNQYLPSTEFKLTSKSRAVGKSRKVQQLDNEARTRQDYSHYRIMLRSLRLSEESFHDNSKIAYLIQEKDLQYLVENIWGAQSILSSWDDLYDLVLVRWDKDEEWSPWNTILLTKDEATAHARLDHLEEAYSKQFVSKVLHKHTLARVHFVKLPGMAEVLRKKTTGSQRLPGPGTIEGVSAY